MGEAPPPPACAVAPLRPPRTATRPGLKFTVTRPEKPVRVERSCSTTTEETSRSIWLAERPVGRPSSPAMRS
ncbi:hypothetical protein ROTAS13_03037 [Roseomonas sp. TAS13]|nr:hypothetical protein ROTAS13_03037 [Roseomonas sp. TAS13]